MKNGLKIVAFLFTTFLLFNCDKEENIPQEVEINNFVWRGMNSLYYWQSDVPDLADKRFSNRNQLNSYLQGFETPEEIFQSFLFNPGVIDRFSWIVDDYIALENQFQGISVSNGMEFKLFNNKTNTNNLYGVVYYVVPGSNAELKGVLRGMVFSSISGTQITTANGRDLLFGANSDYTINLADFSAGDPIPNGTDIDLTKEQLQENPVAIAKVFNEGSGKKIGYLLYNQFASSFDGQLNAAFSDFKSNNIDDLIIDLRYNGGGRVSSATYLGSMINGTKTGEIFSQQVWNEKYMAVVNPSFLVNNFTTQIKNTDANGNILLDEQINSLSLSRVYFIVSDRTASASELVINGMDAYIDVNLVGTQTVGKQVGSITLYDSDNLQKTGENLNTNHFYAMQPITFEIKNAKGENNAAGYAPEAANILAEDFGGDDDIIDLGVLGEKSDPLLERTITLITSGSRSSGQKASNFKHKKSVLNSKFIKPFSQEMYVEGFRK